MIKNKNMIKTICHFSDLHLKLFKEHDLYRLVLNDMLEKFREIKPDRIAFSGDLLHSKNQLSPEVIEIASWVLTECSSIAKTILIPGNHDALINNNDRLDSISPIVDNLNNTNIIYYKNRGVCTKMKMCLGVCIHNFKGMSLLKLILRLDLRLDCFMTRWRV